MFGFYRSPQGLGAGYERPQDVAEETIEAYIRPLVTSPQRARMSSVSCSHSILHTVRVESALQRLQAPTLVVWGTGDIFFDVKWAHWLAKTIPGTRRVEELAGATIFFLRNAAEFNEHVRAHGRRLRFSGEAATRFPRARVTATETRCSP